MEVGSGLWGIKAVRDVALPLAIKPRMSRCQAPSPPRRSGRPPKPSRTGKAQVWHPEDEASVGGLGGPHPHPPGDFRGSRDPEMNELSGPGNLDRVRGRRWSQDGVSKKLTAGSGGVEGDRSERGAGPGPRGPARAVRGLGGYWRWVGPRRHFVERRGSTAPAVTLTIFCFLRRRLSHRLSRRHHHHSRLLSSRRTVTSSHGTAHTAGAAALQSLVRPLALPPSYAAFAHSHWPDPAKSRAHWLPRRLPSWSSSVERAKPRPGLASEEQRNPEVGGGRAPKAPWDL